MPPDDTTSYPLSDAHHATIEEIAAFLGRSPRSVAATLRPFTDSDGRVQRLILWRLLHRGVVFERSVTDASGMLPRLPIRAAQRKRVIERDGTRCRYCGRSVAKGPVHIDHIVPASRGGENVDVNLVVCCAMCNASKGSRLVSETKLKLLPPPNGDRALASDQRSLAKGDLLPQRRDIWVTRSRGTPR